MPAYYPVDDFSLNVARGLVKGTRLVHKQGAVPAMSQNQEGTVWGYNDTHYPWGAWVNANTVVITSAETDQSANSFVVLQGLDVNFNEQTETVAVTANTVNSTMTFKRLEQALFYRSGVLDPNQANIAISVNSTNVAIIVADAGQTLTGVYTVPANHTAYITKGAMTAQASADGTGNMYVRLRDGYYGEGIVTNFFIGHTFEVSGVGGPYMYDFSVPYAVPEKSDIDVRITVRTNNGRFTCAWDMILIKTGLS